MPVSSGRNGEDSTVEIWDYNLENVFERIRELAVDYRYVAMDTEYPGVIAHPYGMFKSSHDAMYQTMRSNINILRIIQLGITFFDDDGNRPPGAHTFQINFKYSIGSEMYAQDSIDLLRNAGIQFEDHEKQGCEPVHFAELLISSGLVLNEKVRWISFQGNYDFGYLVRILTNAPLPDEEADFLDMHRTFFPATYDVKYLMKSVKHLKGGLQDVANALEIERVGPQHQAGSDSLLTGRLYFRMKEVYFDDKIDDVKYLNFVMGLRNPLSNGSTALGQAGGSGSSDPVTSGGQ